MKSIWGLGRNDVIRAVALVSVVAFPLIADAQLGFASKAPKLSSDDSHSAVAVVKTAVAERDACADQHWPFFSTACLRGTAHAIEPRLVSTNAASAASLPNSAASVNAKPAREDSAKTARMTDTAPGNASVRSKKPIKPRVAAHIQGRKTPGVAYAVNSAGNTSPAGW